MISQLKKKGCLVNNVGREKRTNAQKTKTHTKTTKQNPNQKTNKAFKLRNVRFRREGQLISMIGKLEDENEIIERGGVLGEKTISRKISSYLGKGSFSAKKRRPGLPLEN